MAGTNACGSGYRHMGKGCAGIQGMLWLSGFPVTEEVLLDVEVSTCAAVAFLLSSNLEASPGPQCLNCEARGHVRGMTITASFASFFL